MFAGKRPHRGGRSSGDACGGSASPTPVAGGAGLALPPPGGRGRRFVWTSAAEGMWATELPPRPPDSGAALSGDSEPDCTAAVVRLVLCPIGLGAA